MNEEAKSELLLTPAVNLLGVALVTMKFYHIDDTEATISKIIPEFFLDEFMLDYKNHEFSFGVPETDFMCESPAIYRYFIENGDINLGTLEHFEIEWAIYFPVVGFPAYIKGYELN